MPRDAAPTGRHADGRLARWLARTILLALAYLLLAQAATWLALAPGYASPVWPAAGLALAAMIVWGPHCWPGVWLGAFVFNVGLSPSLDGAAAAVIATGSTLQAVIGARLTRPIDVASMQAAHQWRLLWVLLLRGPVVCLVAATVGVAALYGSGLVPREALLSQWLVWAAGDTLGVLLFTPLFVRAWPGATDANTRHIRRLVLPLLATATLLTLGHLGIERSQQQHRKAERANAVSAVVEGAIVPLLDDVDALVSIERLFAASDDVSPADFAAFTAHMAVRPELLAVEWAPRVLHADRAAFERGLDAASLNGQRIVAMNARFEPLTARPAPEYFPVRFSEPKLPNECAFGLDYGFDPRRAAAMAMARDRAEPIATATLKLVRGSGSGVQVFVPVYYKGFDARQASVQARRDAMRGYVVGLYDTTQLLAPMTRLAADKALSLRVTDVTDRNEPQLLLWTAPNRDANMVSRNVRFANRDLHVELGAIDGNAAFQASPAQLAYLAASLVFALLASFAFTGAAGRAEAFERDLALRERMQAEQRTSELHLATTLDSIGDAVIAADATGVITRVNRAAERLSGRTAVALVGQPLVDAFVVIDDKARQAIEIDVRRVVADGGAQALGHQALLVAHDGSQHPVIGSLAPIVDAAGAAQGVVLVLREVGAERAMLAELTESEERFRALTSLSSDWFWEQDAELRFVQITGGSDKVGGIPHHDHVGRLRWELPFTEIVGGDWGLHRADLQARRPFRNLLMRRHMPDGIRYVLASGAPRYAADGSFAGYRGIGRDVTEEKLAEFELIEARNVAESANRAKSAFLANMSHEIRTPMNGVVGMVDVLATSKLSADQDDAVQTIRSSALSLLGLIDELLDFSKIEAGHLALERTVVELGRMVEGIGRELLEHALGKNVLLTVFVDPRIPPAVWSDPTRLRQVLYNLVGNAIKFSGGRSELPGRVALRVELIGIEPLRLAFIVADNGIGMSAPTVATLFNPFMQAEASTTRRFGGTGLGLAISRRQVELMQGTIGVKSEPGVGSVFRVELPLEPVADHPPRELADLTGIDCVVIDMAPLPGDDMCTYLEHAGAHVRRAPDVDAALLLLADAGPSVVVRAVEGDGRAADPMALAFIDCPQARHLLLRRGRYGRARADGPDTVTIDADALTQPALLLGVAMAAGRRSQWSYRDADGAAAPAAAVVVPTVAQARSAGSLVLVAEDDPVNQKVILRQLALLGFAAEVANDGVEALELWRSGGHALLLSDLHMPSMDGYTMARCIRSEEPGDARMPILALTANALQGEAIHAHAAGMDAYLTKPIQLEVLKAALRQWAGIAAAVPSADAAAAATTAAPASASAPGEPVDLAVLRGLVGDDDSIVEDFLRDYLTATRSLAPMIATARERADPPTVAAMAHKLKSSSRSIGALALGDLCAELENAARAGIAEAIAGGLRSVDAELARVQAQLQDVLAPVAQAD